MTAHLDLDLRSSVALPIDEDELQDISEVVLAQEGITRPCYVSVSVVDDDEMRALNLEWRGIDATTDVISLECERPDDPDLAEGEPCELGDIVLAPGRITSQAAGFGTTPADECRLLFVHGLLHLVGYDDVTEWKQRRMRAAENRALKRLDAMRAGE